MVSDLSQVSQVDRISEPARAIASATEDTLRTVIDRLPVRHSRSAVLSYRGDKLCDCSYLKLSDQIDRLAAGLIQGGARKGDRVVLLAPNSPEWLIACLAAIKAGLVVAPVDAQLDDATIKLILSAVDATHIFTVSTRAESLTKMEGAAAARLVFLDREDDQRSYTQLLDKREIEQVREVRLPDLEPGDTAALFFTSGTTAAPKGVPLAHRNFIYQLQALRQSQIINDQDRVLMPLPFHHTYPFTIALFVLSSGLPLIMPESLTGPKLIKAVGEGHVTIIVGVPRLFHALYTGIMSGIRSKGVLQSSIIQGLIKTSRWMRKETGLLLGKSLLQPLHQQIGPHLRLFACGGAPIEPELAENLEALGWAVAVGYGLTETAPLLTIKQPGIGSFKSVGRALPGTELRIEELPEQTAHRSNADETEELAPETAKRASESSAGRVGKVGEIQARGPGIFQGYLDLPEKTEKAFTADGWFRTGDLGYFDGPDLNVLGRISSLIVTESGKKIDPDLLEEHYSANPIIKEIGVLQHENKLVAVIVPDMTEVERTGGWDLDRIIRDAIDERALQLPTYKRLMGYVLSRLPIARTAMGKVKRHKLVEMYSELTAIASTGAVDKVEDFLSNEDRVLLEHPVAKKVWQYLESNYGSQRLTLDASPTLDLGVDSLEWLALSLDLQDRVGIELDDEAVARIRTVRDLLFEAATKSESDDASTMVDPLEQPETHLNAMQRRYLTDLNAAQKAFQKLSLWFIRTVCRTMFKLEVIGLENVSAGEQYVFAPNHSSYLDAFALAAALPYERLQKTHWAGWTGIAFGNPIFRFLSRLAQAIPIDADRALVSSLALGATVLKSERSLVWFPEGRRTLTGELLSFKGGLGLLIKRYPVKVVPVLLKGTAEALPPGSWRLRPAKVTVSFGAPVDAATLEREGNGAHPHERVVYALRKRVQALDPAKKAN